MAKTIAEKVTKGGITVIHFTDGSFMVIAGEVQEFEGAEITEDAPQPKEVDEDPEPEDPEPEVEKPKKEEAKKEASDDDDYWTPEDIEDLTKKELVELIDDEELDVDADEIASVRKLRKAVMKELGI